MLSSRTRLLEFLRQKADKVKNLHVFYGVSSVKNPQLQLTYVINVPLRELCEGFPRVKRVSSAENKSDSLSDAVRSFEHALKSLEGMNAVTHVSYRLKGNKQQRTVTIVNPFNVSPHLELAPIITLSSDPDIAMLLKSLDLIHLSKFADAKLADIVPEEFITQVIRTLLIRTIKLPVNTKCIENKPVKDELPTSATDSEINDTLRHLDKLVTELVPVIAFNALADGQRSYFEAIHIRGSLNRGTLLQFLCWIHYATTYLTAGKKMLASELRSTLLSIFKEWYSPGIKSPIFDSLRTVNNHLTELSQVLRKHNADRIEDLLDSLDKIDPNDVRVILDSPFHLETHRKNPHKEGIYICVHCGKPAFQRKAQTLLMTSRQPTFSQAYTDHELEVVNGVLFCAKTHKHMGVLREEPEFRYQIYSRNLIFKKKEPKSKKEFVPADHLFKFNSLDRPTQSGVTSSTNAGKGRRRNSNNRNALDVEAHDRFTSAMPPQDSLEEPLLPPACKRRALVSQDVENKSAMTTLHSYSSTEAQSTPIQEAVEVTHTLSYATHSTVPSLPYFALPEHQYAALPANVITYATQYPSHVFHTPADNQINLMAHGDWQYVWHSAYDPSIPSVSTPYCVAPEHQLEPTMHASKPATSSVYLPAHCPPYADESDDKQTFADSLSNQQLHS